MQSCTIADLLDGERHKLVLGEPLHSWPRCRSTKKGLGSRLDDVVGAKEGRLAGDHVQRKVLVELSLLGALDGKALVVRLPALQDSPEAKALQSFFCLREGERSSISSSESVRDAFAATCRGT